MRAERDGKHSIAQREYGRFAHLADHLDSRAAEGVGLRRSYEHWEALMLNEGTPWLDAWVD